MFYVYVLKSEKNQRFYTGSTIDVTKRLGEHNAGKSKYDKINQPFILLYQESHATRSAAIQRERYLKTGVGREELQRIILGL